MPGARARRPAAPRCGSGGARPFPAREPLFQKESGGDALAGYAVRDSGGKRRDTPAGPGGSMKSTKNLGCRRPPKGCGRTDGRADPKGGRRAAPRPPDVAGGPKGAASASASFTLACVRRGAGAHSGWPRSPAPRPTACACPPPPPRWQDGDRGGGAAGGGSGREDGTILSRHAKWTGAAARTVCMGGLRDTIATRGGDGPPLNQKRGATVAAASVGRGSRPPPPRSTPLTGASAGGRTKPGPRLAAGEGGAAHPSGVAPCREGIGGGGWGGHSPALRHRGQALPASPPFPPPFLTGGG